MNFLWRVLGRSVTRLTRMACWLALAGLATMSYSIISPRPLPVIFAMSIGQGVGMLAFFCYLLAVMLDVGRHPSRPSVPPSPGPTGEGDVNPVAAAPSER